MGSVTQASSAVSVRYAGALIDLASDSKLLSKVEKDMKDLGAMIADSADLQLLLNSPLIHKRDQHVCIQALAKKAKFQGLTANFLGLLVENSRLPVLSAIVTAFNNEVAKRRGEINVVVQTASALSVKQSKDLKAALAKGVGSEVSLETIVSPDIMGGMIVTVGSHMIDDSIARKLERLRARMRKQANQNDLKEVG